MKTFSKIAPMEYFTSIFFVFCNICIYQQDITGIKIFTQYYLWMRTSIDNNTHIVMLTFLLMFTLSYVFFSMKITFSIFNAIFSFISAFTIAGALHLHNLLMDKAYYRPGCGIGIGMMLSVPIAFILSIMFHLPWLIGSWMGSGVAIGFAFDSYYGRLHGLKHGGFRSGRRRLAMSILAGLGFLFLVIVFIMNEYIH